ncbi:hypothetical protein B4U79_16202 [Dinothrombium tinctorium]|uniref:MYND-type domain-containing protein n=1 Tax=Dinothrombium tinctorium TaxID=1965070 RepID=A0A3S3NUZ2_9ACAR|nr:hypothetical protein B4U79_16202 [Dinothrombium tinctorium]
MGFKTGETILCTQPLVQVLYSNWKGKRCDYCFKAGPVRKCMKCQFVFYCNVECQRNDWNPCHKIECRCKFHEILNDFVDCMETRGCPKWKTAQIQLIFRYMTKIKLDAKVGTKEYNLPYGKRLKLSDVKLKRDLSKGSLILRTASIWSRLAAFPNIRNIFGSSGSLFYNAVSIIDRFQIRITDTSLSIYELSAEETLLGEGFYPELMTFEHSCLPNAAFTFDGTVVSLQALSDVECDEVRINYTDVVGSPQGMLLPTKVRCENLILRGIECNCKLCENDTIWKDKDYVNLMRGLTILSKGELEFAESHVSAISHGIDKIQSKFGKFHPTITLMLYRMAYYQIVKQKWTEAVITIDKLIDAIAITHPNETKECVAQLSVLKEALLEADKKTIELNAIDLFKKRF